MMGQQLWWDRPFYIMESNIARREGDQGYSAACMIYTRDSSFACWERSSGSSFLGVRNWGG
jgi:hypothetical protein